MTKLGHRRRWIRRYDNIGKTISCDIGAGNVCHISWHRYRYGRQKETAVFLEVHSDDG